MSRYALTITLPGGGKWRVRPSTADETNRVARLILQSIGDKVRIENLEELWPSDAVVRWHQFADDAFAGICQAVATAFEFGRLTVLKTGEDLLPFVRGVMLSRGWKEIEWSSIAKHLLKVFFSAVIGWLRVQFPIINAGNAAQAVKVLTGLVASRG